jgi:ribonuclease Z
VSHEAGWLNYFVSQRKFIALGTASQVPTRERNHNGYFVRWDDEGFLFDPGEGTQRQMTFAGVSASEITKIFITHFHGDHCLGLPGVLQRLSLDRIAHAVEIYYPASGQRYFDNLKNASVYTKTAEIIEKPISSEGIVFRDKNFVVETRKLEHSTESWGYRFREPDSVTMLSERLKEFGVSGRDIGKLKETGAIEIDGKIVRREDASVFKKGQSFAFVMDTGVCGAAYELAKDVDFLIIESTFLSSESKEASDYRHLTARQAAEIARDANAKQLVLTHFSQRYMNIEDFAGEARAIFPNSIAVADGQEIEFRREKVL